MHLIKILLSTLTLITSTLLYASDNNSLDRELSRLVHKHNLTGTPLLGKPAPDIKSPMAQLGKRLFFSPHLGGKSDTACVTCHHPLLGGGDNLPLSIGVDAEDPELLGPGRKHSPKGFDFDGGPTVPRNAPSTFNTVFYSRCMFWDCRIESLGATPGMNGTDNSIMRTPDTMWGMPRIHASSLLQMQVAFPVVSTNEMRAKFREEDDHNQLRNSLAHRLLAETGQWLPAFRLAFGSKAPAKQLITFEHISVAIAAYEASQVFVNTPWKNYIGGNSDAISETAKRGAMLFYQDKTKGGYGCAGCHQGDFFTDEQFHVTAMPQIGRGAGDGADETHDYGRYGQTGEPLDKFAFRTPTLLNIEVTGPYGHSGAYRELRLVIRHMLNPPEAIRHYDFSLKNLDASIQKTRARDNTREVLAHLQHLQAEGNSQLHLFPANENHVEQLYQFLLSLTDPCVKSSECLADWIE